MGIVMQLQMSLVVLKTKVVAQCHMNVNVMGESLGILLHTFGRDAGQYNSHGWTTCGLQPETPSHVSYNCF